MAITYTRAAERDQQVVHRALQAPGVGDLVLLAISVVTIGLLSAAYLGRTTLAQATPGASPIVNLNTVADAAALEPALAAAFDNPADRRLAARELFGFLAQADGGRRVLPNVGAIARAEVPAAAIEKDPGLIVYRDRLRDARQRETASPQAARSIPLVTSAELSAVKPSLVVRSDRPSCVAPSSCGAFSIWPPCTRCQWCGVCVGFAAITRCSLLFTS